MNYISCAYCKKRFDYDSTGISHNKLKFCSWNCSDAYDREEDARKESQRSAERQMEADRENAEMIASAQRERAEAERENSIRIASAERDRAAAERKRAEAEREKAKAIKEQTEYLKKQHEEDAKKQQQKENLDELKEKCKKIYTSKDGKITYRMGHRPFEEFDITIFTFFHRDTETIEITVNDISNSTPEGTGTLKLSLNFCKCDAEKDWENWKYNDSIGEYEFDSDYTYTGAFEVLLPPLKPGESIKEQKYQYKLQYNDYIYDSNFMVKVELSEAVGGEDIFRPIYRKKEKYKNAESVKESIINKNSKDITKNKDIKIKYFHIDNESTLIPVLKNGAPSKLEVSDVYSLTLKSDYRVGAQISVTNTSKSSSGTIMCFFVYANKDNLEDFSVVDIDDMELDFFTPGQTLQYHTNIILRTKDIIQYRKNPDYIPYAYVVEFSAENPSKPILRAAVNLAQTVSYVDKRNIPYDEELFKKKPKISEGYVLFDDEMNLFILDKETGDRFYLYDEKTGAKVKNYYDLFKVNTAMYISYGDEAVPIHLTRQPWQGNDAYEKGLQAKKNNKHEEAYKQFCIADEYGHPKALLEKAYALGSGTGVEQDRERALKLYKISAAQGSNVAQYNVGIYYANGYGCEKNMEEAFQWYLKSAKNGDADGMYKVGVAYAEGLGVAKNPNEAKSWLTKAVEAGSKWAPEALQKYAADLGGNVVSEECEKLYKSGLDAKKAKNYKTAFNSFSKGAALGDAKCQYELGEAYYNGYSVAKDYAKAVEQYKKAAEKNISGAIFSLGYCYKFGQGVTKDINQTISLYEKAVELGNSAAMNGLGYCYENGEGVNQDYKKALELYNKAAEKNNSRAMYHIATFYENGYGVPKNWKTAKEWYEKAAKNGDADAQKRLKAPTPKEAKKATRKTFLKKHSFAIYLAGVIALYIIYYLLTMFGIM